MGKFLGHFVIKVGGQAVSEEFMRCLEEVVVDSSLYLPSLFTIRLWDDTLKWADDTSLAIGKEVEITAKPDEESGGQESLLIKGEITALEPEFSATGRSTMTLRGYDKSHRLHRGRKTRTFLSKSDSDLAGTLASEAGLSASTDSTSVIHEHVLQNNQTNMEFLRARAERIGFQVFAADGKLYFKQGDATLGDGPTLTFMENLLSFRPCWSSSGQADVFKVKGWDAKGKKAIEQQKSPNAALNQGGMTQTGGALASSAFSSAEEVITAWPVATADEATALAQGMSDTLSRDFVQAEGLCDGNPGVKAGYKVTIKNVGTRFSGKYLVTAATHVYTSERYETSFTISGRRPGTLSHLLDAGSGHGGSNQAVMPGVVTAVVSNLNDPDDLGRVKVKYAWLGEIESWWARIAAPMAGAQRGLQILPEINDEVLIAFEHGDVHRPYIVGGLWSSTDKPPKKNSEAVVGGKVNQRVLKTRQGHLIVLDDKQGEELISITSKSGHTVILDDKSGSEKITIRDKTGNNEMVINSTNNSMTINVNGDFSVTAKGKITLKSTQDMTLEASSGNAKMKGIQLGLEGVSKGEMKAPMISVNGSAQTEVKGGAMVQVQGGVVKIN